jgi:hypothetical protein
MFFGLEVAIDTLGQHSLETPGLQFIDESPKMLLVD